MHQARKLFDCPCVFKGGFNAYVLSSLECCAPVCMSWAKPYFGLLDSVVRSTERLCEDQLCCLRLRRKVSSLWLLYKIYHRTDHPMNEYLKHFVAALSTRTSTALGELALVMPRCRID